MKRPLIITIIILVLIIIGFLIFLVLSDDKSVETGDNNEINCLEDTYNCADFITQAEAQNVFDICGPEDVHRLDSDSDGIVCESLP